MTWELMLSSWGNCNAPLGKRICCEGMVELLLVSPKAAFDSGWRQVLTSAQYDSFILQASRSCNLQAKREKHPRESPSGPRAEYNF